MGCLALNEPFISHLLPHSTENTVDRGLKSQSLRSRGQGRRLQNNVVWTQQRHCTQGLTVGMVACIKPTQNHASKDSGINWWGTKESLPLSEEFQYMKTTKFERGSFLQGNGHCQDLITIYVSTVLIVLMWATKRRDEIWGGRMWQGGGL